MSEPTIRYYSKPDLPHLETFIVRCCREWPVAGTNYGRCSLCGERPVYERPDDGTPLDTGAPVV